jgi:hypothetical protein
MGRRRNASGRKRLHGHAAAARLVPIPARCFPDRALRLCQAVPPTAADASFSRSSLSSRRDDAWIGEALNRMRTRQAGS